MMFKKTIYSFVIYLAATPSYGQGEKKVTFIYDNSPPYYIVDGPFQGVGNYLLTALTKELPDYSFNIIEGSSLRIKEELKKKSETICTAISGVLEDESLYYSIPSSILKINQGYYFQKEKENKFSKDKNKFFLLEEIPANMRFGIHQGYTHIIPNLEENKKNITFLANSENIHKMLFAKRFDYILSSAEEVNYYKKIWNIHSNDYLSRVYKSAPNKKSIRMMRKIFKDTGIQRCAFTFVMCNHSETSREFIKAVNPVLMKIRKTTEYKEAIFRWVPDELKSDLNKVYDVFVTSEHVPGSYIEFEW